MAPIPTWSYATLLAPEATSVSGARAFVGDHLRRHGLPHLADDMRLVASELATNALQNAQSPFRVALSRAGRFVLLVVEDDATMFSEPASAEPMATRGRGLSIVGSLSARWGVSEPREGWKSVWAAFDTECAARRPGDGRARHGRLPEGVSLP